jgi:hypothetical protein
VLLESRYAAELIGIETRASNQNAIHFDAL